MLIPCDHVIQCRLAPLPLPCVLLLYVGVPPRVAKEVIKFVVAHYYILVKRLCIVPPATRMCTVQVTLHNCTIFFLFGYPVFRRIPHFSLPCRVGGLCYLSVDSGMWSCRSSSGGIYVGVLFLPRFSYVLVFIHPGGK